VWVQSQGKESKWLLTCLADVLLPSQNKLDFTLIVCLNLSVHQWVEEARKIGVEIVISCTSFNQDLLSSLHNNVSHKICNMSANMLKNYTNFLTSHTFIRVVFNEVDAKNCSIQFIKDSIILVSATVLELLDSLCRKCGSQFSKNLYQTYIISSNKILSILFKINSSYKR